jgi:hypothetical protein
MLRRIMIVAFSIPLATEFKGKKIYLSSQTAGSQALDSR